jgi:hypothetical protein
VTHTSAPTPQGDANNGVFTPGLITSLSNVNGHVTVKREVADVNPESAPSLRANMGLAGIWGEVFGGYLGWYFGKGLTLGRNLGEGHTTVHQPILPVLSPSHHRVGSVSQ